MKRDSNEMNQQEYIMKCKVKDDHKQGIPNPKTLLGTRR